MHVIPNVNSALDSLYLMCPICCGTDRLNFGLLPDPKDMLDLLAPFVVQFSQRHNHRKPIVSETYTPRIATIAAGRKFREDV